MHRSPREPLASLEHLSRLASHDHHPLQHLVSHNPMQTPPSRRVSVVPNVIPPQTLPSPNGSELSYAIRHATHSPENAMQVHEQQYDAPTSKKGDDQQAQDPDEVTYLFTEHAIMLKTFSQDIVIGPGRISDANHLILEGGFSVIQDKVIEMATQTGLPPTQILRLWMKKFGRIRPQQNMWNIYEKYFTANRDLEEARDLTDLDGYNDRPDDMDKDSSQFRRLCYESFKREHEDSWREVLEAFQVTKDLSTVTTVGGRQRTFLSAYKHVHTILEMYQKREGFESIWGFVGKNVNSDTSLCRIYESKGAENFFSVRFRAHEHIVKSQLKAHVYNTSSLEVAQQIYDDDETKGSKKDNITESHDDGKSSDDVEEPPAGSRIPYIKSEFIKRAGTFSENIDSVSLITFNAPAKVGGTISVTQFPWKTMPKVFSVQGIQCINYPEDARLPGELTSGNAKSKGIADLTRKEEEALVEALRGNPPLTFVSVPDERKKVLIGAAPRAGSRHSCARQMFANGKTDRLGPARVTASDSDDDESEKENAVRRAPRRHRTTSLLPHGFAVLRLTTQAPKRISCSRAMLLSHFLTTANRASKNTVSTRQFEAVVIPTRTPQSGTKPATNSVIEISSGSGSEYQPESESDPFISPVKKASSRPIDELQKTFERNVDMLAADSDSSIEFISGSKAKHDKKIELPVKVDKGKKRLQSESEGEDADETMLKKGKKKARVQHTELRHAASEVEKPKKRSRPEAQSDDADEGKVKKEKKKARVQHTDVRVAPSEATLPTVCAPRPKPRPTYRGAINKGKGANISHVDEPQTVPADIADIPTEASTDEAPSVQAAGMNNHSDGRSRVGAPADEQDPALVAMYSPGRYDEWDQHAAHDIRPLPPHNTRPLPSRDSRGLALRDVRPLSAHDPRVLPPDTRAPYPHDAQPLPPHEARRLPLYDAPRLPAHDPRVLPPNTRAPHAHDAQPLPPHEARRLPLYDAPLLPPHDLRALAHDARPLLPQDARGLSPYDPRVLHSQPQSRYHSQAMPYHAQPYYPPEYGPWYDTLDGRRTADGMMGHYPEPGPSDHRYQEQYGAGQPDPGYPRRLPAQYPPGYPRERYAEDGGASGYGQEDEPPK
ncbi:hypothetical protein A0H81_00403 [Grifola frondosa]|uniref:Uncharacterized protein n=1 Tax=Grifola frondosa TaxID=5627 RepID=A0A1C7MNU0_GRIFR|nr:hypothetical protein A0H81_00403 [Grifola frondosa]